MRHPSEYWIKFLLSRRQHSIPEIEGLLVAAGIGGASEELINNINERLKIELPNPFRPHDLRHQRSVAFLRREGIYEAWHRNHNMRAAIDILGDVTVRPLVETYILSPLKPDQSAHKIEAATGREIEPQTIELFRHYFWNPTLLNIEEWGSFIQQRDVAYRNWLQLAVTARGPQGVQLVLWKTGTGSLRHVEAGRMFTHLRNIAYMKALELEHAPADRDNSMSFRNYVHSAKMAQEEVTASAAAMMDILDSFQAFKMRHTDEQVTPINSLLGAGDTVSEASEIVGADDSIGMDDY